MSAIGEVRVGAAAAQPVAVEARAFCSGQGFIATAF